MGPRTSFLPPGPGIWLPRTIFRIPPPEKFSAPGKKIGRFFFSEEEIFPETPCLCKVHISFQRRCSLIPFEMPLTVKLRGVSRRPPVLDHGMAFSLRSTCTVCQTGRSTATPAREWCKLLLDAKTVYRRPDGPVLRIADTQQETEEKSHQILFFGRSLAVLLELCSELFVEPHHDDPENTFTALHDA